MSTPNKRKSAAPQPNLDDSLNPPPNKAIVTSNTLICLPTTSFKARALEEIQQQVELFTMTKADQANRTVDLTTDNADTEEANADISIPEDFEAMLVDYIDNEEFQDTAATTHEADKEPARIAPQEQILPRWLFIPKTDNQTELIENAESAAITNSFTANFTASGGIIFQPFTLEAHESLHGF